MKRMWESLFRKKSIDKIISDQAEMENLAGNHLVRNLGVRDLTGLVSLPPNNFDIIDGAVRFFPAHRWLRGANAHLNHV
jgi:hypothetical protein